MLQRKDPETINKVVPITGIRVYRHGTVEVVRENKIQSDPPRGDRAEIKAFSRRARERLALTAAESPIEFCTMITLTYGVHFPHDGRESKKHLTTFLKKMKRTFGGFDYLWFLEFQRRGAPHYHILTDLPGGDATSRSAMSTIWCESQKLEFWKYSSLKTQRIDTVYEAVHKVHKHQSAWDILRSPDGAARYALKYALKMNQKVIPKSYRNVGRLWGTSKPVKAAAAELIKMDEQCLRSLLDIHAPRMADFDVLPAVIFGVFG